MAKPIILPTYYLTEDGNVIVKSNSYIYSITLGLIYPKEKRYEQGNVKYISSPTPLHFKKTYKVDKSNKEKIRVINIEWEAAPSKYIAEHNLQIVELKKKK